MSAGQMHDVIGQTGERNAASAGSAAEFLARLHAQGRICPQPQAWNRLWETLPGRTRQGAGWQPPAPLILAAWAFSSDGEKRARFEQHLAWAEQQGALAQIRALLAALTPAEWHMEER